MPSALTFVFSVPSDVEYSINCYTHHNNTGPPSPPQNLKTTNIRNLSDSVLVDLKWDQEYNIFTSSTFTDHYTITTVPPTSTTSTSITSVSVNLSYNVSYIVSVTATNCAGDSIPTEIRLDPYISGTLRESILLTTCMHIRYTCSVYIHDFTFKSRIAMLPSYYNIIVLHLFANRLGVYTLNYIH